MDIAWHYTLVVLEVMGLVALVPGVLIVLFAIGVLVVTVVVDDGESPLWLLLVPVLIAVGAFTFGLAAWGWPSFIDWHQRWDCSQNGQQWDAHDVVDGDCLPKEG